MFECSQARVAWLFISTSILLRSFFFFFFFINHTQLQGLFSNQFVWLYVQIQIFGGQQFSASLELTPFDTKDCSLLIWMSVIVGMYRICVLVTRCRQSCFFVYSPNSRFLFVFPHSTRWSDIAGAFSCWEAFEFSLPDCDKRFRNIACVYVFV